MKSLPEIRGWFGESPGAWMLNVIEMKRRRSFFIAEIQRKLGESFSVRFDGAVAEADRQYLRKEIIEEIIKLKTV
ncbi:hypothetical protein [Ruminococcus sp.]|uniref:hypothetical protein n=1 Tax=Ruminococcus sp. TaxID=41978 RepID=UPI0025FFE6ED|nr:hypothetical protein [Ruminococcus sp.]MBR1431513.1 hypothetical protein [Ruminococcus sp.]